MTTPGQIKGFPVIFLGDFQGDHGLSAVFQEKMPINEGESFVEAPENGSPGSTETLAAISNAPIYQVVNGVRQETDRVLVIENGSWHYRKREESDA